MPDLLQIAGRRLCNEFPAVHSGCDAACAERPADAAGRLFAPARFHQAHHSLFSTAETDPLFVLPNRPHNDDTLIRIQFNAVLPSHGFENPRPIQPVDRGVDAHARIAVTWWLTGAFDSAPIVNGVRC